ncbi:MAG: hypothetical protein GKR89_03935 [Candidatus Latescibacteria bacterium]|nr:hypothetical protein [Candidatus Latescibacterota bacterium]
MTVETGRWLPAEGSVEEIRRQYPEPLMALVEGQTPALVLRQAFNPDHCAALMQRFYQRGLLYDPRRVGNGRARRVDIGTSFGAHRADRAKLFAHSAATQRLFARLFEGYDDPVRTMYDRLAELAPNKEVKTAREPDGQLYGPAIFRVYHADMGHGPHYDSVAKRTKAFDYQIARFKHQFAGVLCLQNSADSGDSGEPFIHNSPWTPALQEHMGADKFPAYVAANNIDRVQVKLEPGDLYFFFSENVHEVPAIVGDQPRAVLAIFFAMSEEDDEIFVWA